MNTFVCSLLFLSLHLTWGNSDPDEFGKPLTPEDFINAEKIDVTNRPIKEPIESEGHFEGDIVLPAETMNEVEAGNKNAIKNRYEKWPNGVIPYKLSGSFSTWQRAEIAKAVSEYQKKTCIQFRPYERTDKDFVDIVNGSGCSSQVGRRGGAQQLSLGNGCVYFGIVLHEMMHAIGFWHEQSRWDRDDYVNIYYENIKPGMEFNFNKYPWSQVQNLSESYDTSSIMHYAPYSFSKNGRPTILSKNQKETIGQRNNLSAVDIRKINTLYNCERTNPIVAPEIVTASPGSSNECKDNNENCSKWAEIGECSKNPRWMLRNCKKSCGNCSINSCLDSSQHCNYWKSRGECDVNPSYMQQNCKKSCRKC